MPGIPTMPVVQGGVDTKADFVRLQDALKKTIDEITSTRRPQLSSELLEKNQDGTDIIVTTGQVNAIQHRLGRDLRGWRLVDARANAVVWRETDYSLATGTSLASHILLRSSATVTIKLEVF